MTFLPAAFECWLKAIVTPGRDDLLTDAGLLCVVAAVVFYIIASTHDHGEDEDTP